ncbi:MAG: hypothetical protein ACLTDR_11590 [Adlercreutzia equolifaciens]
MTDKDPKDMTASELLRWAANYADITCRACRKMGFGCDSGEVCFCEQVWDHIADKIDAELAQARNESLLQGAQVWAKANGWPDFREGEDFGAWLDCCALPRPRFEDGEVVGVREQRGHPGILRLRRRRVLRNHAEPINRLRGRRARGAPRPRGAGGRWEAHR